MSTLGVLCRWNVSVRCSMELECLCQMFSGGGMSTLDALWRRNVFVRCSMEEE